MLMTTTGYVAEGVSEHEHAIDFDRARTPQEDAIGGGSYDPAVIREADDFYRPYGILRGEVTVQEAMDLRERLGYFAVGYIQPLLMLEGPAVFRYSPLDKTGRTSGDPSIVGAFVKDAKSGSQILGHPQRDLNREFRQITEKFRETFRLRDEPTTPPNKEQR